MTIIPQDIKGLMFDGFNTTVKIRNKLFPIPTLIMELKIDKSNLDVVRNLILQSDTMNVIELYEAVLMPFAKESTSINRLLEIQKMVNEEIVSIHTLPCFNILPILRKKGYKLALISNLWQPYADALNYLRIFEPFDVVTLSCDKNGFVKPDPKAFTLTCQKLNCTTDQVIMIGDSIADDFNGATKAQIKVIIANWNNQVVNVPNITDPFEIFSEYKL